MSLEEIEKIKKVAKVATGDETTEKTRTYANQDHFEALMKQGAKQANTIQATDATEAVKTQKPSLIDQVSELNRKVNNLSTVQPQDLIAQAHEAINKIDELKTKLSTPNLELKSSVQNVLRNKLTHINENLKIALARTGVEYKEPTKMAASASPIERFLGFLSDGQYQLNNLANEVEQMQQKKGEISPAYMLLVQIKVGFITQELEFFTSVLNKALESTKTVMNVQV